MLTLQETKLHLRVDHGDEDTLIQSLIATATAACADYLNIDAAQLTTSTPGPLTSSPP